MQDRQLFLQFQSELENILALGSNDRGARLGFLKRVQNSTLSPRFKLYCVFVEPSKSLAYPGQTLAMRMAYEGAAIEEVVNFVKEIVINSELANYCCNYLMAQDKEGDTWGMFTTPYRASYTQKYLSVLYYLLEQGAEPQNIVRLLSIKNKFENSFQCYLSNKTTLHHYLWLLHELLEKGASARSIYLLELQPAMSANSFAARDDMTIMDPPLLKIQLLILFRFLDDNITVEEVISLIGKNRYYFTNFILHDVKEPFLILFWAANGFIKYDFSCLKLQEKRDLVYQYILTLENHKKFNFFLDLLNIHHPLYQFIVAPLSSQARGKLFDKIKEDLEKIKKELTQLAVEESLKEASQEKVSKDNDLISLKTDEKKLMAVPQEMFSSRQPTVDEMLDIQSSDFPHLKALSLDVQIPVSLSQPTEKVGEIKVKDTLSAKPVEQEMTIFSAFQEDEPLVVNAEEKSEENSKSILTFFAIKPKKEEKKKAAALSF